jgi:DNA-binding HxlR family transcriptional regulator
MERLKNRDLNDELEAPVCRHFQLAAELIGRRWNPQIIRALLSGESRFGDMKSGIAGISDALLSERLKDLEARGILVREVTPSTPVRIDYRLTERGRDLVKVMEELAAWAERWAVIPTAAQPART